MASIVTPEAAADGGLVPSPPARGSRLGAGLLTLYGSGAAVETVINFTLGQFMLFYLTIVCGLSGSLAGLGALIALVLDACIDPLVGSLSDNLRSKLGRRLPFMIGATIPSGVALILMFSIPASMTGLGLFAYAVVVSLALRVGLSCFQVPYYALGAELSHDYVERSTIVAFRLGTAIVATIAVTILSYNLFLAGPGGTMHRANYAPLSWCLAGIILVAGAVSSFGTLRARDRLHAPPPAGGLTLKGFASELSEVFRNRSFRVLFASLLLFFVAQGVAGPLTLYANTYFWKISTTQITLLVLMLTGGSAVGIVAVGLLAKKLEKRTLCLLGVGLFLISQLVPAPLRVLGLLPSPTDVMVTLSIAVLLAGVGVSGAVIGYQSMMADAADEHELLFGARREGLYFAGINFSAKASSGLGGLIAGVVLDVIHFPHGAAARAAIVSSRSVTELALVYGPGAAIVSLISVSILVAYRLDRARHAEILTSLGRSPEV